MFLVAGRIMGHSFIHGGPCVSGISPAIIHVLFGGSPETATVQIEDCHDIDIRSTIQLLDGTTELTEVEQRNVLELALAWDLPGVTQTNRKWLYECLLFHAVITRTSRQVKQLRKGLKETMVWPLLTERSDIIPLFLPRESETAPCCKVRVAGYLRSFIENILRLPAHYCTYESFLMDIEVCLNSTESSFGLV
ncbi:G2/M phase-specific E3 ubiquitin-protein ligase [Sarotherodon galilaeus]